MAKASTRTLKIKGVDKATADSARKAASRTTTADETPEAQPTRAEAERAAAKQFRKADEAARTDTADNEKPEETAARMAVRGF